MRYRTGKRAVKKTRNIQIFDVIECGFTNTDNKFCMQLNNSLGRINIILNTSVSIAVEEYHALDIES